MWESAPAASSMQSERSPLIQSVVFLGEYHERYVHRQMRRWCTIGLIAVPFLAVVVILATVAIGGEGEKFGDHKTSSIDDTAPPHASWPQSQGITYQSLKKILLETPDASKAREWSLYYTAGPHLTGKNLSQAEWTRDRWQEFGIPHNEIVSYEIYLNYPLDHRLALLEDGQVKFEASLEEPVLEQDPTTGLDDRIPVFHGYSASGNVTASYVYCNYGTIEDFEDLQKAGVSLQGKIALIKYGGICRGLKIKRASELGMIGAVIYSDPGDDGDITEAKGYKPYPDGPARHAYSVQRGSVSYLSIAPGDPTTIGYPSKPGAPRQSPDGKIPDIPSLPISYAEALPLLKALNSHGPNASSFPDRWRTGGLGYKGVEYNIGPSPSSLTINLVNEQEYVTTPAWNVIGIINGTIPDEVIVIGNHRDAWIAGGAGDPNSGSAALNEVVRSFGIALAAGWKPLRTIVFASWDGEEYALLGSTEWVEEYLPWLSASAVAYINVDVGAVGPHFGAAAAPLLNKAIREVTSQVLSPNQSTAGQTVSDTWDGHIRTMGSGSDFTAFQDFAGISCIDVGFGSGLKEPVYHYHSNYDSFHWMDKFGDPGFEYHVAIAKIIGLLAAKLVEEPIVQFNATDYAVGLEQYLDSVKQHAEDSVLAQHLLHAGIFKDLDKAIAAFQHAAVNFDAHANELTETLGDRSQAVPTSLYPSVRITNSKYKLLERQFLYAPGLDSRTWFKHVVFAPGLWTGYAGATFSGLVEALDEGNLTAVEKWAGIIEGTVRGAAELLAQ